jgi:hypothetical protein
MDESGTVAGLEFVANHLETLSKIKKKLCLMS